MFKNFAKKATRGFTLIEILVVIGIIAILATIVIVAINPARQFAQANNTTRTSNINTILNAVGQRMADNKGQFEGAFTVGGVTYKCGPLPTTLPAATITGSMATDIITPTGDLGCLVPTYLTTIPSEPIATQPGYTIVSTSTTGRVTISAPGAELGQNISVTR